jgi:hypothetical protein
MIRQSTSMILFPNYICISLLIFYNYSSWLFPVAEVDLYASQWPVGTKEEEKLIPFRVTSNLAWVVAGKKFS